MTHPLPPWNTVMQQLSFSSEMFWYCINMIDKHIGKKIQKLYKLPFCHRIYIDHLTPAHIRYKDL